MERFCPLCAKSGNKRKVKAFQINLEEAIWACEAENVNNFLIPLFCILFFTSILIVLLVFQCSWPIGYEELVFFNRPAISCNWEEEMNTAKEDIPALTELSLYTPPVTPGGELSKELTEITSTEYSSNPSAEDKIEILTQCEYIDAKESDDSNKSSLFESLELGRISSNEENGHIAEERVLTNVNIFKKFLPTITNIEKTNINLVLFPNIGEHCDNKKIQEQEHSLTDATVMHTFKNFGISDSAYTEVDLISTAYKIEDKQSESLQSDITISGTETLSETMKTLNIDVTNSSDPNKFIETALDIEKALMEDIFGNLFT